MNPILSRYVGFALVALIAGAGGGMLAVKEKTANPSSGTVSAIPAQTFPGQGAPAIRAVPAIPAQPQKGTPDVGAPVISYVQGDGKKNQVVNPMLTLTYGTPMYVGPKIVGKNFSDKNTVYWDNKVIFRDISSVKNPNGTEEIYLPVIPVDIELGSFHNVSVSSQQYGKSNMVQVQAVEHLATPWLWGIHPSSGGVGMKGEAKIWDSWGEYSSWPGDPSPPLSVKHYLGFPIVANKIKSGAEGIAYVFIPTALERVAQDPYETPKYSFEMPNELIYCPSWAWTAEECTLAPSNTMIPLSSAVTSVNNAGIVLFYVSDYKYRGIVKGLTDGGWTAGAWWDTGGDQSQWSSVFKFVP